LLYLFVAVFVCICISICVMPHLLIAAKAVAPVQERGEPPRQSTPGRFSSCNPKSGYLC
jgi:hypothetical protein